MPGTPMLHRPPTLFWANETRPPKSALFPYTTLFRSVLTRQFRMPAFLNEHPDGMLIEAPGGLLDGDDPLTAMRRELEEERSEEHTSELQSQSNLVCRLLLEKKKMRHCRNRPHTADSA